MDVETVIDFWFGAPGSPERDRERPMWFAGTRAVDDEVRARLGPLHTAAASGAIDSWRETHEGCLALILLLDQVPRNIFRGTPAMFATDVQARGHAAYAYAKGFDRNQPAVRRWFYYLPFTHSEEGDDQKRALALFDGLRDDLDSRNAVASALWHEQIIARFGRFPHRNAVLGRTSTEEELAFLASPEGKRLS
jgi:uncharacterized protein (DUF924 family)